MNSAAPSKCRAPRRSRPQPSELFNWPSLSLRPRPSRRKATRKREQQFGRTVNPNLSPEQRPHEVRFLAQKAQPRVAIRGQLEVRRADVPVGYFKLLVSNHDRGFHLLLARKREVIRRVQAFRFDTLEHEIQPPEERADRPLPCKAVREAIRFLMREA